MVLMGPARRYPDEHTPSAGMHLSANFDQPRSPCARETFTQGVALAATVEESLAVRCVNRGGRQIRRQVQFRDRRRRLDDDAPGARIDRLVTVWR